MNIEFTPNEARVIGCLIEKEITTPDQYPLSLNALTNACNQKTNREPVLELSEAVVQQAVDSLMKKYMVSDKSAGYGGRVTKYRHRFCNTEFGPLKFSNQELGILCVLLLRGPQTPGELRSRTNRLCEFADAEEVETTLQGADGARGRPLRRPPAARRRRTRIALRAPVLRACSNRHRAPAEPERREAPAAGSLSLDRRLFGAARGDVAQRREIDALQSRCARRRLEATGTSLPRA